MLLLGVYLEPTRSPPGAQQEPTRRLLGATTRNYRENSENGTEPRDRVSE